MANDELEQSSAPAADGIPPRAASRRRGLRLLGGLVFSVLVVAGANWMFVHRPVAAVLRADPRNEAYTLVAHWGWGVWPDVVVLDLVDYTAVSPADLMRGLFQSGQALCAAGLDPSRVELARRGRVVFQFEGAEFIAMGTSLARGENPVYLIRTLPEKAHKPDGSPAFGAWEGGIFAVLGKQMEDANRFARMWMTAGVE